MKHRKLDRNLARHKRRFAKPAGIFVALFMFCCICSLAKADSILPGPTYSTTGAGTVSLNPDASVFADAVIGPMESGGASATLTYYFEVVGPANVSAAIDITGEALVAFDGVQDGTYFGVGAGIYSTKPGVLATPHHLDDSSVGTNEVPMAVMGIVPCKVSAENGPIARGDLLVTSSRPGYAMKGTDRPRMLGAVVGKALEPLPKGRGVIQVLVTLQ